MPSMAQVLGPALVLATLIGCPESPRVSCMPPYALLPQLAKHVSFSQWLANKNRVAEASAVLSKIHANGVADDPLVRWELAEILATLEGEKVHHQTSYLDFLKTAGNQRRLIVLLSLCIGSNWVGNGIIS
jgi:hypothetical protein